MATTLSTMNVFSIRLLNVVRSSAFQLAAQGGTSRGLISGMPCKLIACRTFVLSLVLHKDSSPNATKLDLDGWKHVMRSAVQEETTDRISESEDSTPLAATRELIEMWRLSGKAVPENINEEELKILMDCASKTSKKKYLKFLATKENMKNARKEKQEQLKKERKEQILKVKENSSGELKNTFLLQFWSKSEDTVYNWRAAQAMIFGQPLVFDMAYENYMMRREMENAVKQLMELEGVNRRAVDPFHLFYCSLETDGPYHKEFVKRYREAWDKLFLTVTEKVHAEIFPRDQLIYLTADSPNIMKTFEHDKIYIIGTLVDKSIQKGLSLARAKRLNLRTARLPLETHLQWAEGAKNLTLDQMMRILLTLKDTGDWKEALKFVPQRKHAGFVETIYYPNHNIDTCKKTKMYDTMTNQGKVYKPFARNSVRQEMQRKWWQDV